MDYMSDMLIFYIGYYMMGMYNLMILLMSLMSTLFVNLFVTIEIDPCIWLKKKITLISFGIMAYLWLSLWLSWSGWIGWWVICCIGGFIMADFMSGFFHWVGDTVGLYTDFFLFVHFRIHHQNQTNLYLHNFWSLVYDIAMLSVVPMVCVRSLWLYFMCSFLVFANITHQYSHLPVGKVPGWIRWLQKWGLILSPEMHKRHHVPPYKTTFCTLSGWCNIVDRIYLWHGLDRVVQSVVSFVDGIV